MNLFSYIVRYDLAFAPNPFHGFCPLGTCKAPMREQVSKGDWVVGTGSAENGLAGRLVFAMQVDRIVTFEEYWDNPEFSRKKPVMNSSYSHAVGDNIYHRNRAGQWVQKNSHHSHHDGTPNIDNLKDDTSVNRVLVGNRFAYWGRSAIEIPDDLDIVHKGQHYRRNHPPGTERRFLKWFDSLGVNGCLHEPVEFEKWLKKNI
ncbi:MAG: hypothetical protein LDL44_02440 [Caenispirillum sp.]|nr:hypothetical protein [Caenispirillum sp.]